ncbi:MAG: coproporphyrinogen III oxidase [Halomonas subglaciescola]|nr:coproporphyrinogen III oxidase [Halomonas subglaciescola]
MASTAHTPAIATPIPAATDRAIYRAFAASNAAARPLSLYVHLPFSHRNVTPDVARAEPYLSSLDREMRLLARHLDTARPVEQLYWGGETPTLLTLSQMSDLFDRLDAHFRLSSAPDRDYAIKLDPREADVFTLRHLQLLGFNRLSLAVLDFNPGVQRAIDHEHSCVLTETLMEEAHRLGFRSLNIDVGYGLPKQTRTGLAATLEQIVELNPARITLRDHSAKPSSRPRAIAFDPLQQPAERLIAAGYVRIGSDHFARPDDRLAQAAAQQKLQHSLQGYTTHGHCDLIGLGVAALSRIDGLCVKNHACMKDYTAALDTGQLDGKFDANGQV